MQEFKSQDSGIHIPGGGHEASDVAVRGVMVFAVMLAVLCVFVFIAAWALYSVFDKSAKSKDAQLTPLVQAQQASVTARVNERAQGQKLTPADKVRLQTEAKFPEPRLQYDDVHDMALLRLHEAEKLGIAPPPVEEEEFRHAEIKQYDWVDKSNGVVRIPIDRAMQLMVDRGLPVAEGTPPRLPAPPVTGGNIVEPSRSSSHLPKR